MKFLPFIYAFVSNRFRSPSTVPISAICPFFSMGRSLSFQDLAVNGYGDNLEGNTLSGGLHRFFGRQLQPAAAGDLHAHDRYALDVVVLKDLRQFSL